MKERKYSTRLLVIGFGIISFLFSIFASGWIYTLNDSQHRLQEIIKEKEKEKLVNKLKNISLRRNISIVRMLTIKDHFERDAEYLTMLSFGSEFIKIRDTLVEKYFDEDDLASWKNLRSKISHGENIQKRVIEILSENKEIDTGVLVKKLFDSQDDIAEQLGQLTDVFEDEVTKKLGNVQDSNTFFYYVSGILLIFSIIFAVVVINYVIQKIRKSEDALFHYGNRIRKLYNISSESGVDENIQILHMIEACCNLLRMDNALVFKVDDKLVKSEYEYNVTKKLNERVIKNIKENFHSFPLYIKESLSIPDLAGNTNWKNYREIYGDVKSFVSIPFNVKNNTYGILCFVKNRAFKNELSEERMDLVKLVSSWLGYSIEHFLDAQEQKRLKELAESLNSAKTEFLGNMSHELRTPMHAILSYSGFGIKRFDEASEDKKLNYFLKIQKSANSLLDLLNNILDLSKLESNKMDFNIKENNFNEMLYEVLEEFEELMQINELDAICNLQAEMHILNFDATRIKQVVRNLISNAIKFASNGTRIIIETSNDNEAFNFTIIDQGVGIPDDELTDIFDKFKQSSKTSTGAGGTGLGLAICREIINSHYGKIWAENNLTNGAVLKFSIPLNLTSDEFMLTG